MTLADFQRHLTKEGCQYEPLSGVNITGIALKIKSPHINRSTILALPKGGELSDRTITNTCDRLLIKYPSHLV